MARVKLIASDGMILTNGETYGREVFLGTGDSADNWWEITEEEFNSKTAQEAEPGTEATVADYESALAQFGVEV